MIIAIYLSIALAQGVPDTLALSAADAVALAHDANLTLRAERAAAAAARRGALEATPAFLPSVAVEVRGIRTTDPVAVFGARLRQGTFGPDDFALDALNRPAPFTSYDAAATIEQPLFAPEGLFGYGAARRAADAREAAADRAAGATVFQVTQAYWDARVAAQRRDALDTALAAARAHTTQAEAMRDQGLVTGLDARLARIRAAEIETQRLAATADAENALSALRALLDLPESTPLVLSDSLTAGEPAACEVDAACDLNRRGDLAAHRFGAEAAQLAVKRAWAANLPAVAAFASVAHRGESAPWGGGSGDWTLGIGLTWHPFRALAGVGAVAGARAERDAMIVARDAAVRRAEMETLQARRHLVAALARVTVAQAGDVEGREALEQARLRYRAGMAPSTELLDVQAAATAATLNLLAARRDLRVARAALDLAYGVHDR
jgi:outer membrane protein TolC